MHTYIHTYIHVQTIMSLHINICVIIPSRSHRLREALCGMAIKVERVSIRCAQVRLSCSHMRTLWTVHNIPLNIDLLMSRHCNSVVGLIIEAQPIKRMGINY